MNSPKRSTWLKVLVPAIVAAGSLLLSSCSMEFYNQEPAEEEGKIAEYVCRNPKCTSWMWVRYDVNDWGAILVKLLTNFAQAPAPPCPAIDFAQASSELMVGFDSPVTTTYLGVLYRQAAGSYTAQGFATKGDGVATKVGTLAQAQGYFALCRGINMPTPAPHPTVLADMPGTMSQEFVVASLGGAAYATIGINGTNITVALDTVDTLGQSKTDYPVFDPASLLVADFNGDGKRDVAVLNYSSPGGPGSVQILLGNGNGTLRPPVSSSVGSFPGAMTSYDFNHDGRADLAVVDQEDNTVIVLLANLDGSTRTAATYNLPGGTYQDANAIVAADFDGDGKADLMVYNNKGFTLLHGNGDGSFQVMPQRAGYTPHYLPLFLAPGDFNKDGKMDLASFNLDGTVAILLNAGDGSFPSQLRYVAGTPFSAGVDAPGMFAMDFNDDGNLDLVLASGHPDALYPNPLFVTVLFGKGDGTFAGVAPAYEVGAGPVALATADFNGDGQRDLVVADSRDSNLWILLGNNNGFPSPTKLPYDALRGVATADLNGDGRADVIALGSNYVVTWLGKGDGTFQAPVSYAAGTNATFFTAGDVNGDGLPDLVISYGDANLTTGAATSVLLLTAKSGGGFNPGTSVPTGANTTQVALADVNGDGILDLVAANLGYAGDTPVAGNVTVSLGKGDGTFQAPVSYTVGLNPTSVAVADVNGDGKPDLIVGTVTADVAKIGVLLGNGNGTFITPAALIDTYSWPTRLSVADFDGDGKLDLVIVHWPGDSPVSIMRGNGDGTFQPETMVLSGDTPEAAIAADFSGDGRPDLAVLNKAASPGYGYVSLFRNTSATSACTYSLSEGSQPISATGGTGSFKVIAGTGCDWTAASSADWIRLTFPAYGSNNGTVNFSIAQNSGAARSGTVTAGGQTFTVNQAAGVVSGVLQAVSVDPAAGTGSYATYTFSFSDSAGWQNISVANVLINNFINGIGACYVAVVPSSSSIFLVDDAGDAGGPYQGMVLPGSGTVQNSQCSITAAGSSIAGSGNTLTVALAITFKGVFAGNKVMYLSAREAGGANSGWQALGTCGVPGSNPTGPAVGGVTPARSSGPGAQTFAFTFTDTNGWQDLGVVNVLINDALNGNQACYLAYSRPYNVLYLVNDAGTALSTGLVLNGSGSVGNSQCTVTGAGSSASGAGNTLTLTLNLTFSTAFAGNRVIYMAARSNGDALNSGWQAVGSRSIQ